MDQELPTEEQARLVESLFKQFKTDLRTLCDKYHVDYLIFGAVMEPGGISSPTWAFEETRFWPMAIDQIYGKFWDVKPELTQANRFRVREHLDILGRLFPALSNECEKLFDALPNGPEPNQMFPIKANTFYQITVEGGLKYELIYNDEFQFSLQSEIAEEVNRAFVGNIQASGNILGVPGFPVISLGHRMMFADWPFDGEKPHGRITVTNKVVEVTEKTEVN